jgi:alkylated DNA repair protein alkB family protein 6
MEDTTSQNAAAAAEQERAPSALALRRLADYATGAIPTVFYVPDFISHSEQSQLLHNVLHPPNPVSFYSFAFSPLFLSILLYLTRRW